MTPLRSAAYDDAALVSMRAPSNSVALPQTSARSQHKMSAGGDQSLPIAGGWVVLRAAAKLRDVRAAAINKILVCTDPSILLVRTFIKRNYFVIQVYYGELELLLLPRC